MEPGLPIRVVIVDDHPLAREGLVVFLQSRSDIQLVGAAASGAEAIAICSEQHPDIVLMDLAMPGMDGVTTTRAVLRACPDTRVIALTSFQERRLVKAAFEAGVVGYLLKDISGEDLASAIIAAHSGRPVLAAEATMALISCATDLSESLSTLTKREMDVLTMMVDGLGNAEIAKRLFVSQSTVKARVSGILSKFGVATRTEAVAVALRRRVVE